MAFAGRAAAALVVAVAVALTPSAPPVGAAVPPFPVAAQAAGESLGGGGLAGGARVRPVPGEVVRAFDPPATRFGAGHRGVDLVVEGGSEVVAVADGVVAFAGLVAGVGWVSVDHSPRLRTTYGPLDLRTVVAGERVRAGARLGWLAAEATHLDWGARLDGEYIDPLLLLRRWRPVLVAVDAPPPARLPPGDGLPAGDLIADTMAAGATPRLARWPTAGRLSSAFGPRTHPVTGSRHLHSGIDIAAPAGRPVLAAASGTVVAAGWRRGYGRVVDVDHGGGLLTRSAHLSRADVGVGDRVDAGQRLGAVGCTGTCTGPHLHFEVRMRGTPVDPRAHLP